VIDWITDPQAWVALVTLTAIEIVLGIDNIVFISILSAKLRKSNQSRARTLGLAFAMITRILLLLAITWVMRLTRPLFSLSSMEFSGRDLILMAGGLFLLAKSTLEIHDNLEGEEHHRAVTKARSMWGVVAQIAVLDIVFSLDSVITAVGLAEHVPVMVLAIVVAVGFMMLSAGAVSRFIDRHPTVKILALSFLLLIGLALTLEGIDIHVPKTSIYFAMGFSVFVEMLNLRMRSRRGAPVELRGKYREA